LPRRRWTLMDDERAHRIAKSYVEQGYPPRRALRIGYATVQQRTNEAMPRVEDAPSPQEKVDGAIRLYLHYLSDGTPHQAQRAKARIAELVGGMARATESIAAYRREYRL
jgi:hypothetical protein